MDEMTEAMMVVAEEVINTGRPGKVTLTLTISQASPGEPTVVVNEDIKRTAPKRPPKGAFLFIGDREFHRKDPRQQQLDFRVVDEPETEVRKADEPERTVRQA